MSDVAIRGIDVHTYLVKDPARAIAFYRDVMQLKPSWEAEQGAEFDLGDGATFVGVRDARAAADYYRARGANVMLEIVDNEHCLMAFVEDTEGNHFILHQRKG
jgi:predicted enzyme related to lactoylglutathione lyase